MADQRPDGADRPCHPGPDAAARRQGAGLLRLDRLGRRDLRHPAGCSTTTMATAPYSTKRLPAMVKWVDFVWSISDGPIVTPPRAWGGRGFTFGDWLQPAGQLAEQKPLPHHRRRRRGDHLPLHFVDARRPGRRESSAMPPWPQRMDERAAKVQGRLLSEFVTPSGRLLYDDQTSYALAIVHDLFLPTCCPRPAATSRPTDRPIRRPHRHGLHRHAGAAAGAAENRRARTGRGGFLQEHVPGLALSGEDRRDDDLGALGRHRRGRQAVRPGDEFLQPLRLWRGLPVAVRGGRRLPAGSPKPGVQAHHLRADDHPGTVARSPPTTTPRRPHRSRLDGRRRTGYATRSPSPREPTGTLLLSPRYADVAIDGKRCRRADSSAQPPRARPAPRDVPNRRVIGSKTPDPAHHCSDASTSARRKSRPQLGGNDP